MFVITRENALTGEVKRIKSKDGLDYGELTQKGTELGFGVSFAFGGEAFPSGHVAEWWDWGGEKGSQRARFRFYEIEQTK